MDKEQQKTITIANVNLSMFAVKEWFRDITNSTIWLRIYTSLGIPQKDYLRLIQDAVDYLELDGPVAIAYAQLDGFKIPWLPHTLYAAEDGMTKVDVKVDQKELVKTNYVILSTPFKTDGVSGNELSVRRRLNIVSGITCLHAGWNFLREVVFEGEVSAHDEQCSVTGEIIRMPQVCEGPFLHHQNWEDIRAIARQLRQVPPEARKRIELSLEFLDRALREDDAFFYYWTALEILCNGTAQAIRAKLRRCYQLKNVQEVDDKTGFGVIAAWRHDFFHKGIRPHMTFDVERYIQMVLLDLLRQELFLPLQGHTASLQHAVGYDLSSIGLADNRTDEQKKRCEQAAGASSESKSTR